jgi:uncharacterized protein YndB with AHSA1/START domain
MMSSPQGGEVVELEIRLGVPPADVFPYLVEPERYVRWQGVEAELDPRPGGLFRVRIDAERVARGQFVEVESPRRLVFTWGWEGDAALPPGSTTVELTLEQDGVGTILRLRHTGLPDDASAALHREGWILFTGRLNVVVGGGDPGPMSAPGG